MFYLPIHLPKPPKDSKDSILQEIKSPRATFLGLGWACNFGWLMSFAQGGIPILTPWFWNIYMHGFFGYVYLCTSMIIIVLIDNVCLKKQQISIAYKSIDRTKLNWYSPNFSHTPPFTLCLEPYGNLPGTFSAWQRHISLSPPFVETAQ